MNNKEMPFMKKVISLVVWALICTCSIFVLQYLIGFIQMDPTLLYILRLSIMEILLLIFGLGIVIARKEVDAVFKETKAHHYFDGIALIIILDILIAFVMSVVLPPELRTNNNTAMMFTSQAKNYPVLIIIVSCIIGPIQEELINRYFVMKVVLKNINQYVAAFIQAIIFAVFHGTLMQGITAFILGFVIGLMYIISDSLLPCIIMHIVVNITAILGSLFSSNSIAVMLYVALICVFITITLRLSSLNKNIRKK